MAGWLVLVAAAASATDNATRSRVRPSALFVRAERCVSNSNCAWVPEDPSCTEALCRRSCVCRPPERFFGTYGRAAVLCGWLLARVASLFLGGGDRGDDATTDRATTGAGADETVPLTAAPQSSHDTSSSASHLATPQLHTGPLLPLELFLLFSLGRTAWGPLRRRFLFGSVRAAALACVRWAADASSAAALLSLGLSRQTQTTRKRGGLGFVARWSLAAASVAILGELLVVQDLGKLDLVLDPFLSLGVLVAMTCGPYDTWAARWLSYWSLAAGLAPALVDAAVSDFAGAQVWHRPGIHVLRASAEVLACWATGDAVRKLNGAPDVSFAFVVAGWSWLAVHFGLSVAAIVDPRRFRVALGVAVVALYGAFSTLTDHPRGSSVPLYAALFVLAGDHEPRIKRSLETCVLRRVTVALLETAAVVAALSLAFQEDTTPFFLRLQPNCVLLAILLRRLDDAAWSSCDFFPRCRRAVVVLDNDDNKTGGALPQSPSLGGRHHRRLHPPTPPAGVEDFVDVHVLKTTAPSIGGNAGDHDDRKTRVPDPRAARVRADATRNHLLVLFLAMWILVVLRLMPAIFPFSHPAAHAC